MIVTIIAIRFFVNTNFKNSFEKYVDDSNKTEINHLIEFDLKSIYLNGNWDIELIENLGIDSKELQLKYMMKTIIKYGVYLKMRRYYQIIL